MISTVLAMAAHSDQSVRLYYTVYIVVLVKACSGILISHVALYYTSIIDAQATTTIYMPRRIDYFAWLLPEVPIEYL